jgi:hypothetical protein
VLDRSEVLHSIVGVVEVSFLNLTVESDVVRRRGIGVRDNLSPLDWEGFNVDGVIEDVCHLGEWRGWGGGKSNLL